ncbi:hypothetical protein BC826DRAFT_517474 [Russula brevipes]|nr:hypothetical protein BC826DRAFT_517474 [Russula brevipes]
MMAPTWSASWGCLRARMLLSSDAHHTGTVVACTFAPRRHPSSRACSCSDAGKARVQINRSASRADAPSRQEALRATDDTYRLHTHATPSPTPTQVEEQHDTPTEAPNGRDASIAVPDHGQADTGTDGQHTAGPMVRSTHRLHLRRILQRENCHPCPPQRLDHSCSKQLSRPPTPLPGASWRA